MRLDSYRARLVTEPTQRCHKHVAFHLLFASRLSLASVLAMCRHTDVHWSDTLMCTGLALHKFARLSQKLSQVTTQLGRLRQSDSAVLNV